MDRGGPEWTTGALEEEESPNVGTEGGCCLREKMRLTMLFFFVFSTFTSVTFSGSDAAILASPFDTSSSAVNGINGK